MATMGTGNFDNAGAQETRDNLINEITDGIQTCLTYNNDVEEGGEQEFMPLVQILSTLCEHCGATPPEPDVVSKWRKAYLNVFDEQAGDHFEEKSHIKARRKVIEETFKKLEDLAVKYEASLDAEDVDEVEEEGADEE